MPEAIAAAINYIVSVKLSKSRKTLHKPQSRVGGRVPPEVVVFGQACDWNQPLTAVETLCGLQAK
jgi:hypothetical protein